MKLIDNIDNMIDFILCEDEKEQNIINLKEEIEKEEVLEEKNTLRLKRTTF